MKLKFLAVVSYKRLCRTLNKYENNIFVVVSYKRLCRTLKNIKLKFLAVVSHKRLCRTVIKYKTKISYNCLSQKVVSNCEKIWNSNFLWVSLTNGCLELWENMKLKYLTIVFHKKLCRTMSKYETKISC